MTPTHSARPAPLRVILGLAVTLALLVNAACANPAPRSMPPGLEPEAVTPGADRARAGRTLDDLLPELALAPDPDAEVGPQPGGTPPTDAARLQAVRHYTTGRLHALAGDEAEAERHFRLATTLDPDAEAPWRELGELQLRTGNPAALAAFERVLTRNPSDPRALLIVSQHAAQRQDHNRAARLMARLVYEKAIADDPALPFIIYARLGEVLGTLGYDRAAWEALTRAAALPDRFDDPTRFADEIRLLYRARPDLWRLVGDAALRLEDVEAAAAAYDRAMTFPTLNPLALVVRQVHAALLLNEPARAAAAVGELIRRNQGAIPAEILDLVAYIARDQGQGEAMRAELQRLHDALPDARRRLVAGSTTRARAAASSPADAIPILLTRLLAAPRDNETLIALFDDTTSDDERLTLVTRLIDAHPLQTPRFVRRLVMAADSAGGLAVHLLALPEEESASRRLLVGAVLEASARPREALRQYEAIATDDPAVDAAARAARAGLLFRLGRLVDARSLLEEQPQDAVHLVAAAGAWEELLDARRAWEAATAALDLLGPGGDVLLRAEAHRLAGANARRIGRLDDAVRHYEAAAALTPWAEEPFVGLYALYAESGDRPDEAQRIDIIRRAREAVPDGRVIQSFRIREAVSRRQFDIAERLLFQLLEVTPHDLEAVATLRHIWLTSGQPDTAEAWLKERRRRFPAESVYAIELATVLVEEKQETEALALLEEWIKLLPGSPDVSRRLEQIHRDPLRNDERADALAWKRVEMLPAGLDVTIEKMQLLVGADRFVEARRLMESVDADDMDDDALARLGNVVLEAERHVTMAAGDGRLQALDFCMAALERFPALPLNTHLVAVVLACRAGFPIDEIVQAVDRLDRFSVSEVERPLIEAIRELSVGGRPADALTLSAVVAAEREFGVEFLMRWLLLAQSDGARSDVVDVLAAVERQMPLESFFRESARVFNRDDYDPAELVMSVAQRFSSPADDARAIDLYRMALRINPNHAMCLNNLGYRFLERGERLAEAERLISRAHDLKPGDAAVTDSLGWVRYKLGHLHDDPETDAPGAITLLRESIRLASAAADNQPTVAVVSDHLGDALWAAGQYDEAREAWLAAVTAAQESIDDAQSVLVSLNMRNDPRDVEAIRELIREMQIVRRDAGAKVEAIGSGTPPAISPIPGPGPEDEPGEQAPPPEPADVAPPPADAGIMVPSQSRHIRFIHT